jgi:xanthine dehydrogenase YagR molybdenum-binding subunit
MADAPEERKLKVGVRGGATKEIKVDVKDGQPVPWDLDTKFALVGTKVRRLDAVAKVTGAAKYTYDVKLPGMVYGKFVRAPHACATVVSVDVEAAKKVPGVVYATEWGSKNVKYPWQAVAVVAAENRRALEAGLRAVKVQYEVKPHAARLEQAIAEGAPLVNSNQKQNKNGDGFGPDDLKNVEEAQGKAAKVVKGVARTQVQTHSALETKGVVVQWLDDGKAKVWASTQGTFSVRGDFARTFKVKESDVQVVTQYMGGGFGAKFGLGTFGHAAGTIARELKRPCKFMLDRKEEHMVGGNRPDSVQDMTLGVAADGKLSGYKVEKYGTGGTGGGAGAQNPLIYDFGPVAEASYSVATNAGAAAAFRAPGHPQGAFAAEAILDMAAEAIGMDPLELRKKNDDHPIRTFQYVEGAKLFGWDKRKKNGADAGPVKRGIGVASCVWFQLGGRGAACLCRIRKDGSVEIRNGAQDIGTGTRTILAMVAAEELGLPLDGVTPFLGDTNDPIGPGSGGSTTAPTIMPAARTAAFQAGRELRGLAAAKLGCAADDLVLRGGKVVHAKDAGKSMSFADACKLIEADAIESLGARAPNFANFESTTGGVHFAEVEVDTETGKVRVLRYLAMQDTGTVVNRSAAESQVNGAVIQGLSYALFEDRVLDRHRGVQLNADLEGYKIAGAKDMPAVRIELTDVNMGANNVGLAGLGEGPAVAPAAAIANAVHNALGVRVWQIPMTPDKVLAALATAKTGGGK